MSAATSTNRNCTGCADVILSAVNPGRCAALVEPAAAMTAEEEILFHPYDPRVIWSLTDALWMHGVLKIHIDPLK